MNPNNEKPSINVTADAVLVRKPEVAYVSLYVRAEGVLLEDAVREASGKTEQVLRALRDTYGPDIKDLQIKDIHAGDGKPAFGAGRDKKHQRDGVPQPRGFRGGIGRRCCLAQRVCLFHPIKLKF